MPLDRSCSKILVMARAVLAGLLCVSAAAAAQPDITGNWELRFDSRSVPDAALTPAAAQAMGKHRRKDLEGMRWCRFIGMPQQMDGPLDIRQSEREIVVDTPMHAIARHFYIDGRKHIAAEDFEATTVGNSVAHWEGEVLVVDTVGLSTQGLVSIPGGGFRTATSHLVERYRLLPGGDMLAVQSTWTDPTVFRRPHSYEYHYYRSLPGTNAREWPCEPNDAERARFFAPVLPPKAK